MKKDFKKWHGIKESVHNDRPRVFFNEQEVWFSFLGANVGFEQDGVGEKFLRPVVIIKKFSNETFWGVVTTKKKRTGDFYFKFSYRKDKFTTAILSQIRTIDSKRLLYKIGFIRDSDFKEMKKRLISFLK